MVSVWLRRAVRRGFERTGLIGPYYRWLERRIARSAGAAVADGRPMPPRDLIVSVSGGPSEAWFSERGQSDANRFASLAARYGTSLDSGADVLDFGCGSGRIARWLAPDVIAGGGRFFGVDLNPRSISWCSRHLPGEYAVNRLQPPLNFPSAAFDLIYAHSVLTHLTEPVAKAWLAELSRLLRPGGLAIVTFLDEDYAKAWAPKDLLPRLDREPYVVWNNALEGSNYMSAWTTRAYFSRLAAPEFDVLDIEPGGTQTPDQATAVLRARGRPRTLDPER